jgi:hypothetical protein
MRNSVTNKLHTQNALRVVIHGSHGIVYSHEIVFTQPMTSDNVFCGIN